MTLLIVVGIYFCIAKYRSNKTFWPFHDTNTNFEKLNINKVLKNMVSNDELKEIDIKSCICYFLDDIIRIEDFGFDYILLDKKSYENILSYEISYITLFG